MYRSFIYFSEPLILYEAYSEKSQIKKYQELLEEKFLNLVEICMKELNSWGSEKTSYDFFALNGETI